MLLVVQVPTLVVESFVVQHEKETQIFVNKIKKQNEEVTDTLEKRKVRLKQLDEKNRI